MRRYSWVLALVAILALAAPAIAGDGDFIDGTGTGRSAGNGRTALEVFAKDDGGAGTEPTGTWQFTRYGRNGNVVQRLRGRIDCLNAWGRDALASGPVTYSSTAAGWGGYAAFRVQDNHRADRYGFAFSWAQGGVGPCSWVNPFVRTDQGNFIVGDGVL